MTAFHPEAAVELLLARRAADDPKQTSSHYACEPFFKGGPGSRSQQEGRMRTVLFVTAIFVSIVACSNDESPTELDAIEVASADTDSARTEDNIETTEELWSIAVIGTGDMGDSLGPRLAQMGHKITYGSRNPESKKARDLVALTGSDARAMSQRDAVVDADVVLLAVGWPAMELVAQNLGDLSDKIVIDISTPLEQAEDGYMESMVETSSAEMIRDWNPGARLVKTVLATSIFIDDPMLFGRRISTFIASDDRRAKEVVANIVYDLGLIPIDAGPLRHARDIEATVKLMYVPILQRRPLVWEQALLLNNFLPCIWDESWRDPVGDHDDLANFPVPDVDLLPCSEFTSPW